MGRSRIEIPPAIGPEPQVWRELLALPWRRYEILSHLQPADVVAAITRVTAPGRALWRSPLRKPMTDFEGTVEADAFTINRVIRYRNSFLPVIRGTLTPAPSGTLIRISMRPMWFVAIFWLSWMTFVAVFLAASLLAGSGIPHRTGGMLVGAGMLAFGYLVCSIGFGLEARWARQMLEKQLSGRA